jgi:hypothetical protein
MVGHPSKYCSEGCRKKGRAEYLSLYMRNYRDRTKHRNWRPIHGVRGNLGQEDAPYDPCPNDGYYNDNGDFVNDDWAFEDDMYEE